jgi:adenosylhomocysteine nucleosidase
VAVERSPSLPADATPLFTMPPSADSAADCCLGIIFALSIEAHSFEQSVSEVVSYRANSLGISRGLFAGRPVAWAVSGCGEVAAARAAQLIIDGHHPLRLVTAGFAGGLDPGLTRGQLVFPSQLLDGSDLQRPPLPIDPKLAEPLWDAHSPGNTTLLTVTRVITDVATKRAFHHSTGAGLVDMESYAVGAVAAAANVGVLACRVISDTANEALPEEVAKLSQPQSTMRRLGTALGAMGRRPAAAVEFWRLWEQSLTHSQVLAAGLADVISAMNDPSDHH